MQCCTGVLAAALRRLAATRHFSSADPMHQRGEERNAAVLPRQSLLLLQEWYAQAPSVHTHTRARAHTRTRAHTHPISMRIHHDGSMTSRCTVLHAEFSHRCNAHLTRCRLITHGLLSSLGLLRVGGPAARCLQRPRTKIARRFATRRPDALCTSLQQQPATQHN